jgi:predicted ATPase
VQKFYSFEGLIGAGKTTLLRKLEERGVAIIPEPLDR